MNQAHPHRTAFVLQGGGALGACQAGAVCRLHAAGILPDRVAGFSIGAIRPGLTVVARLTGDKVAAPV